MRTAGVAAFRRWCASAWVEPVFDRATVEKFTAVVLDGGAEAATARPRQRGVRRFSAWLADEGEIDRDELAGMRPPKLDAKVPAELTTDQVKAMLATCGSEDFHDIRDEAIIRLMTESMVRAGELLGMLTTEVDIRGGSALVRRGKGGKGRLVPFGPQTGRALDRYARARRRHALAASPQFWLANRQRVMTYEALYSALRRRGRGVGRVHHAPAHAEGHGGDPVARRGRFRARPADRRRVVVGGDGRAVREGRREPPRRR